MTPPAVSAAPRPAAQDAGAPAPAAELVARPPFGRPRPPRPSPFDPRTLAISLGVHAAAALLVWLAPDPAPRPPAFTDPDPAPTETVSYLDVAEWGAMATDPRATLPPPAAAVEPALGAGAADSALLGVRAPGGVAPVFPDRVPVGVPPRPGGSAGTQPAGGAAEGAAPAGGAGAARRSGPGRLGPELGDERLVVSPAAVPERALSNRERYQQHLDRRIQALNDSIAGEAERARRANDWTIRDRNGNRWGLDENGVVIGGRSVPTPRPTYGRPARDREDAARRERDQRAEIDRQAETTERERDIRERQRVIRERADREREARRRAEEEGGANP